MKNPIIADNQPVRVELAKGQEYHFCTCGRSRSQPFCGGSHVGTTFTPGDGQEPQIEFIHQLVEEGLSTFGHHGPMGAMGVPRERLPKWDDVQIMVAQLHRKPLAEDAGVATELVVGPESRKPLTLKIPLLVSDMSFGALSEEAKIALATGTELADTGICSGEGGMLPEEQAANSRYFYELASAMFGYREALLEQVQAFHFKGGQGRRPAPAAPSRQQEYRPHRRNYGDSIPVYWQAPLRAYGGTLIVMRAREEYHKGVINHESQGSDSNTRIRRLVSSQDER